MGLQGLTNAQKETGGMCMHGVTESHCFCSKPDSERNVNLIHAINQVLIQGESLNPSLPSSPSSGALHMLPVLLKWFRAETGLLFLSLSPKGKMFG